MSAVSVWTKKLEKAEREIEEPIEIAGHRYESRRNYVDMWVTRSDMKALRVLLKQAQKP